MVAPRSDTVTLPDGDRAGADDGRAQLVVALVASRPAEPSSRHLLDEIDQVVIGRGPERDATRRAVAGRRRLELRLADPSASEQHAGLTRVHGRWLLEDRQAKNGCLVNGRRVQRATLEDGDVVELGATFLVFRDRAAPIDGPPDLAIERVPAALPGLPTFDGALGRQLAAAAIAAPSTVPVLIRGDTGTGKELVARAIHAGSRRRGAFVAVNCGALPAALVEGELFGHRRGAFSGAVEDRPGHVRAADGGTLLLDEIGDLPGPAQATLLRVLQEREVVPVGESLPVRVDVRVIAATHVDLARRVADGTFRRDLLARLGGLELTLPTLAERREDLGFLIATILGRARPGARLSPAAARAAFVYDWPDNVRELELALTTAAVLAGDQPIELAHLPRALRDNVAASLAADREPDGETETDVALRAQLTALLTEHAGNISAVARATGKARWQIHRWLRRLGLDGQRFRR